ERTGLTPLLVLAIFRAIGRLDVDVLQHSLSSVERICRLDVLDILVRFLHLVFGSIFLEVILIEWIAEKAVGPYAKGIAHDPDGVQIRRIAHFGVMIRRVGGLWLYTPGRGAEPCFGRKHIVGDTSRIPVKLPDDRQRRVRALLIVPALEVDRGTCEAHP